MSDAHKFMTPHSLYLEHGAIYRHYEGSEYRLLTLAKVESTQQLVMVYEPRTGGMPGVRPLDEFAQKYEYVADLE